jgi:nitroreductase
VGLKFDTNEINRLMRERRSVFVKDYSGEKVGDEVVRQMLENATLAPTHKLTEPWWFVVFSGDGLTKLAEFQAACYKRVTESRGTFNAGKYEGLRSAPMKSSHIICVAMKRDEMKRVPEIEETGAVFCAIENMYLTATAYGVGCYLSSGGVTYFEEAKEFFGLGPDDKILGFLHVGIPLRPMPEGRRRPVQEKMKWVR